MNREKIIEFVKLKHQGQVRKYTGKSYFNHLIAVAQLAEKTNAAYGFEIGLCHDLFEDTDCTIEEFKNAFLGAGYSLLGLNHIGTSVIELTDIYTKANFESLNRKERKNLECKRLHNMSPDAQTVKCADIINNAEDIFKHDKSFAELYIKECITIIKGFTKADKPILSRCWDMLNLAASLI